MSRVFISLPNKHMIMEASCSGAPRIYFRKGGLQESPQKGDNLEADIARFRISM